MDKIFEDFIENLVTEALQGAKFSYLSDAQKKEMAQKLREHFYNVTVEAFVDQLTDEQVSQVKGLDFKSEAAQQKIAEISASIPGFSFVLENELKSEMDRILQTGQIQN